MENVFLLHCTYNHSRNSHILFNVRKNQRISFYFSYRGGLFHGGFIGLHFGYIIGNKGEVEDKSNIKGDFDE